MNRQRYGFVGAALHGVGLALAASCVAVSTPSMPGFLNSGFPEILSPRPRRRHRGEAAAAIMCGAAAAGPLPPGPCSYRATGSKRARRRAKGKGDA